MELIMNGMTVLCLMVLIVLQIIEMDERSKKKPTEKQDEKREEKIVSEFEKLMNYSEDDAINSKKR